MQTHTTNYLVFRVGREWYGIRVDAVIEVLHMVALNEVPGDDALGVITLRERAVRLYDLRQRFGIANPEYKLDTPIIAVNGLQGAIGLVVDETDDVIRVSAENIAPYSDELIKGVVRVKGRMIFVLELPGLVAAPANLSDQHT